MCCIRSAQICPAELSRSCLISPRFCLANTSRTDFRSSTVCDTSNLITALNPDTKTTLVTNVPMDTTSIQPKVLQVRMKLLSGNLNKLSFPTLLVADSLSQSVRGEILSAFAPTVLHVLDQNRNEASCVGYLMQTKNFSSPAQESPSSCGRHTPVRMQGWSNHRVLHN